MCERKRCSKCGVHKNLDQYVREPDYDRGDHNKIFKLCLSCRINKKKQMKYCSCCKKMKAKAHFLEERISFAGNPYIKATEFCDECKAVEREKYHERVHPELNRNSLEFRMATRLW